jgi:hypothetical protein
VVSHDASLRLRDEGRRLELLGPHLRSSVILREKLSLSDLRRAVRFKPSLQLADSEERRLDRGVSHP